MKNKLLVIAHRGNSSCYAENTIPAFNSATDEKSDMIEFDVHFTKDFKIVVTHDFKLGRCIKAKGTLLNYTLDDLKKFSITNAPSLSIPTLEEVILNFSERIILNIEVKKETIKTKQRKMLMAKALIDLIKKNNINYSQLIISSFDYSFLRILRSIDSDIKIGILNNSPRFLLHLNLIEELKSYSYHPNYKYLNKKIVSKLKQHSQKIYPYTANTVQSFKKLLNLQVDGIISNEVQTLRRFVNEV